MQSYPLISIKFTQYVKQFETWQSFYRALHLRFEKGMVGLSFCDFVGNRQEKAMMAAYRQKEWPRRYKVCEIAIDLMYSISGFSVFINLF
jgi:hypothetical protein